MWHSVFCLGMDEVNREIVSYSVSKLAETPISNFVLHCFSDVVVLHSMHSPENCVSMMTIKNLFVLSTFKQCWLYAFRIMIYYSQQAGCCELCDENAR